MDEGLTGTSARGKRRVADTMDEAEKKRRMSSGTMDEIEESGGKNATEGNNGGSRYARKENGGREKREREYVCALENKGY